MTRLPDWSKAALGIPLDVDAQLDPPRCNQCGRQPPTHARHCPKVAPFGPAAAELAAIVAHVLLCPGCGAEYPRPCAPGCERQPDALGVLLGAVASGATLTLHGPPPHHQLQTLYLGTTGASLVPVLVELAEQWKHFSSQPGRVAVTTMLRGECSTCPMPNGKHHDNCPAREEGHGTPRG
jgi:hypothetical protein